MLKRTMKKCLVILLLLSLLLALPACGLGAGQDEPTGSMAPVPAAPEAAGSLPEEQSTPAATGSGAISLITDFTGLSGKTGPSGLYEIVRVAEDGRNIVYTDYATASRIFLCSRPECLHADDSCASWVPFDPDGSNGGTVMVDASGSRLLYIGNGMAPDNSGASGIYTMDPNGANRRELYRLKNGEVVEGAIASDARNLYFQRITIGDVGAEASCEICRLDLESGALSSVTALEEGTEWLTGAFDDKLVIAAFKDGRVTYRTLPPAGGDEVEVYSYDASGGDIVANALGDKLVLMRQTGEATGEAVSVSLRDGSEATLQTGLPMISAEITYPLGCYGSLMVWELNDNRDPDQLEKYCCAIDVETGALAEITLTTKELMGERPLWVFADAGDDVLVVTSEAETGTRTITDNAGNPYNVPVETMARALISKADYLANQPNFTPVTDTVPE